jgi:hypothetical protein
MVVRPAEEHPSKLPQRIPFRVGDRPGPVELDEQGIAISADS